MATCAELAGVDAPKNLDSISFVPTLTGKSDKQQAHRYLYWEFYERGGKQAVRQGKWKAVRMPMLTGQTELYDLDADLGEETDIAAAHPEIVKQLESLMKEAHVQHPNWKISSQPAAKK